MTEREKEILGIYNLMVRTYICMGKYEEEIGDNNRYVWLIGDYEKIILEAMGLSDNEIEDLNSMACDLAHTIENDISGE